MTQADLYDGQNMSVAIVCLGRIAIAALCHITFEIFQCFIKSFLLVIVLVITLMFFSRNFFKGSVTRRTERRTCKMCLSALSCTPLANLSRCLVPLCL